MEWTRDCDYREIKELPPDLGDVVALDAEARSEGWDVLKDIPYTVQISDKPGRGFLIRSEHLYILKPVLKSKVVFHTAKSDAMVLENAGFKINWKAHEDVMLEAMCLDTGNPGGLKEKAARDLFISHPEWSSAVYSTPQVFLAYSVGDADLTIREHELYYPKICSDKLSTRAYQIEKSITPALMEMERNGMQLDIKQLKVMEEAAGKILIKLEQMIHKAAGVSFNVNAHLQVGNVIFGKLGLKGKEKTKGGKSSTSKIALEALRDEHPIVNMILTYRRIATSKRTSIGGLLKHADKNGMVHTDFLQAGIPTKRLASIRPSLLNQPKHAVSKLDELVRVRKAFIPSPGYRLVSADASQIEFRLMLYSSRDEDLISALEKGADFHTVTGRLIVEVLTGARKKLSQISYSERDKGKTFNYALPYGMDEYGLSRRLNISLSKAKGIFEKVRGLYGGLFDWIAKETQIGVARKASRTLFGGHLRNLPMLESSNKRERMKARRNIVNDQIQGGAAEIFKICLFKFYKAKPPSWRMLLPVHDQIIFEIPEGDDLMEACRFAKDVLDQDFGSLGKYPFDVSTGPNWQDMKEVEFKD